MLISRPIVVRYVAASSTLSTLYRGTDRSTRKLSLNESFGLKFENCLLRNSAMDGFVCSTKYIREWLPFAAASIVHMIYKAHFDLHTVQYIKQRGFQTYR